MGVEGGKNELSVVGYFEPEADESGSDDDEDGVFGEDSEEESEVSDDETAGMTAPVMRVGATVRYHRVGCLCFLPLHSVVVATGVRPCDVGWGFSQGGRIEDLDALEEEEKSKLVYSLNANADEIG